ncbi:Beta-1,3-glucan-binding protein [Leucoagaricus sp. SymC.cos]|nr:Beta-1,3-glucan-binding protein [Leucoagaricus sp. SymC.cos]
MSPRRPSTPPSSLRSPPSSFVFPFQAYPGNPDPGTTIPGRRRFSVSSADYYSYTGEFSRPYAPFMAEGSMTSGGRGSLPRSSSTHSFRAPFLSPASRPGSSFWSPPTYTSPNSGTGSTVTLPLPLKSRAPLPSTRLTQKLDVADKPWLSQTDRGARLSWWITFACIVFGIIGAGLLCYLGATEAKKLDPSQLCLVFSDDFSSSLDDNTWTPQVELGGFGNGEFEMTTTSSSNLHITDNQLYLTPTLTTVDIPNIDIFNGNYTLDGCTTSNKTACAVHANPSTGTIINPVRSARINTKGKKEIRYGRVEIRAKLPQGNWLWPSITLLPSQPAYTPSFPASGLITLLSSRGNPPTYPSQGSNFIYSSLAYAPLPSLYHQIFGWYGMKRYTFTQSFHTFVMEWDEKWMRFYVDGRLQVSLEVSIGKRGKGRDGFWEKAGWVAVAHVVT